MEEHNNKSTYEEIRPKKPIKLLDTIIGHPKLHIVISGRTSCVSFPKKTHPPVNIALATPI